MEVNRGERGAVIAEFALILPLLALLVFGIIQFSIAFNRYQGIHAAAREGGRTASLPSSTDPQIRARVTEALAGITFDAAPAITIQPGPCANRPGQQVRVTVTAPHTVRVPFLPNQTVTLTGRGVFRCE
jgi:Flp pilus assembly protein TadG